MNTDANPFARRPDLDALRAVAMLLGIVLHAALSFFPSFWIVSDSRPGAGFGTLVTAIHGFRMPLFFLLSGYFSAMLICRRGPWGLVRHRFARVVLPLLLGMVTIVPAVHVVSAIAIFTSAPETAGRDAGGKRDDLWAAAEVGDLKAIERHLDAGAAVNGLDPRRQWTPLLSAALADRGEAVELLIRRGADPSPAAVDGGTPLHGAAFLGNEKAVAALLAHGAKVNARNKRGETPLDNASIDEVTTRFIASLIRLPLDEKGLGRRKAAVVETLRQHGAVTGTRPGLADILKEMELFGHLWFLWFLWWLVLGLAAVWAVGSRLTAVRLPDPVVVAPCRYLWLVPLTMLFQAFMGSELDPLPFGPDTSTGPLPIPHVLGYYAVFFGFGALLFGRDDPSERSGGRWWLPLAVALFGVLPAALALGEWWPGLVADPSVRRWLVVVLASVYPWLMSFGLMGLFRRLCAVENETVRYLSDSSYWLYLAHLPLVIGAQYLVRDWPLPAVVKFALIVVSVTGVLLLSYEWIVRYTWLGRLLNGPRTRPSRAVEVATAGQTGVTA
jgi:peptidoglycan/LPS O-acetylase OafA/YrhL